MWTTADLRTLPHCSYSSMHGRTRRSRIQLAHWLGGGGSCCWSARQIRGIAPPPHRVVAPRRFCASLRLPQSCRTTSVSSSGLAPASRCRIAASSPHCGEGDPRSSSVSRPCGQRRGNSVRFETSIRGPLDGTSLPSYDPRRGRLIVPTRARFRLPGLRSDCDFRPRAGSLAECRQRLEPEGSGTA